jgi:hypothetical protein
MSPVRMGSSSPWSDQLFLRGLPSRRQMADRGWAGAFRTRARRHDCSEITWSMLLPRSTHIENEWMGTHTPESGAGVCGVNNERHGNHPRFFCIFTEKRASATDHAPPADSCRMHSRTCAHSRSRPASGSRACVAPTASGSWLPQ